MKKVKEYREDPIWCEEELASIEGYQHCLIKDGKLIFCSCTHEEFSYVNSELKNILWG